MKLRYQKQTSRVHSLSLSYLRINKVSLVVVETSLAEVTVGKCILQEVSTI